MTIFEATVCGFIVLYCTVIERFSKVYLIFCPPMYTGLEVLLGEMAL